MTVKISMYNNPIILLLCGCFQIIYANFITLSDRYTADPAPFVYNGRLYIYTSHDLDDQHAWLMTDYSLMSTDDLTNWRDEGIVFDIKNQSWGMYAWAQQVIQGDDGRFYMFYPAMNTRVNDTRSGVGIAVSNSVTGPFNDVLGKPLLNCGDDPTVFRDDDGQVYFCGNCGGPLCAKLTANLTALATQPAQLSPALPNWFEAPWLSKWNNTYYLSYMCNGNGKGNFSHYGWDICYGSCTGNDCSPLGPYQFRGSLIWNPPNDCGPVNATCQDPSQATGENNHQGFAEFPEGSGVLYLAYHSRTLSKSRNAYFGYQRNVAIDRVYSRSSSSTYPLPEGLSWIVDPIGEESSGFVPVTSTPSWVRQLKYVDAYSLIPATLSAAMSIGLNTEPCSEGGLNLGYISTGSTTMLRGVDFGISGAISLTLRIATPINSVTISLFVDDREAISTCSVPNTNDWQIYQNLTCSITGNPITGIVKNVTLLFLGPSNTGVLNVRYFTFESSTPEKKLLSNTVPPPVTVLVALRAMSNNQYLQVSSDPNSNGVITPSGSESNPMDPSLLFVLIDNEDGTYSLQAAQGNPSQSLFVCVEDDGQGPLCAHSQTVSDDCTRFWLYGTTYGTYAFLSATNGQFVVSASNSEPLMAVANDPRGVPNDGARFYIEEQH
jgi:arabinoxylan arabinofuranohydrolase